MAIELRCPHCAQIQRPTIRVKTIEANGAVTGSQDPHHTRHILLLLVLSLTIVGLPLASWLRHRYERAYPIRGGPILEYAYECSLCGYRWRSCPDAPIAQSPVSNAVPRSDAPGTVSATARPSQHSSLLREFVAWWFRV